MRTTLTPVLDEVRQRAVRHHVNGLRVSCGVAEGLHNEVG